VDCGDVPVSPYDQGLAIDQIRVAYNTLLARPVATEYATENGGMKKLALDGKEHSKIITLGGDHTILLPILGALKDVYGTRGCIQSVDIRSHQCHSL
jgi:agmatinase